MAEFAIDYLLTGRGPPQRLVRALAQRWPNRPALEYAFALSLAANGLEETFKGEDIARIAHNAWRLAALVGVDLYDAQALGLPHHTGADLVAYWKAHDPGYSAN